MAADADAGALMDAVYRHQRHIYDLTRKYYLLGRDRLIARLDPGDGDTVLELGCGTGRNLIAAARRYPRTLFYGIDISSEMLDTAAANVARAGLADRIALGLGDASRYDAGDLFGRGRFDRVFFSYSLSMIPTWREALAAGSDSLAPGGRLSLVDFGRQERLPQAFRAVLFAWLRQFHVTPRADMAAELDALALRLGATATLESLYRGYAVYAELAVPVQSPATK
ncbi:class I SAM-dependent methyltransferase [Polymorphum gilvum]|uniref:Methyltransferase type 11 n=1 Tax=Polymorphum gilvum (strain LMG 25793 / CGMCC 1.9160 / SL003B-26A1) TaxID=991905 RepID=F2IZ26_POLGS|nr:class I SAM-dependent methyltransferase [Polymorphum gilvum]ADZ71749.1 Methyltransferase type 11 [Polymorphum gilvum SL003B-26A1]